MPRRARIVAARALRIIARDARIMRHDAAIAMLFDMLLCR